jgi:hypothetical protein
MIPVWLLPMNDPRRLASNAWYLKEARRREREAVAAGLKCRLSKPKQ